MSAKPTVSGGGEAAPYGHHHGLVIVCRSHCGCKTCLQKFGANEKDLLPEREEQIKWRSFNKVLIDDILRAVPGDGECYACWAQRRTEHKEKGQLAVIQEGKDNPEAKEKLATNRRARVRKMKGASDAKDAKKVGSTSSLYKDNFDEGMRVQNLQH